MYSMVYATASDEEEGRRIGRTVVERRLAACANIFPIRSIYWWKGEVEEDDELALIFKTRSELVPALIEMIQKESSYEIACAVSYPMSEGNPAYLEWIDESTRT
jgi:periplasmic divalent cation tolerance protein